MKVKPQPYDKQPLRPNESRMSRKRDPNTLRSYARDTTHPFLKSIDNIHKGETAWIFGSGVSLDEVWDWNIPKDAVTFALNAGAIYFWNQNKAIPTVQIASPDIYRKRLDYWFAFDLRVTDHRMRPEWDYFNLAIRHPYAKKLVPRYFPPCVGMPNIYKFTLQDKRTPFYKPYKGNLITGDSILTPVLHYCYITGFKRIFLSGIDMCRMMDGRKPQRYFKALRKMTWQGYHINQTGKKVKAPNEEFVFVCNMYQMHMLQVMNQIRFLQDQGIEVYKTSLRGLLSINAINSEKTMKAIINGNKNIRYAK